MKKVLFFVVTILAFSLVSCGTPKESARQQGVNDVKIGAKAGVNFSDIKGDDVDSYNGRTSFHVGAVAEIPVAESFAVQPEIMYSSQGSDYKETISDSEFEETYEGKAKVDYINLPIMAKYYVAEGFSIEAGPQVGFLTSAKFEEDGEEYDFKDDLKGIDFGLNFGLGYKLESGLNFGARYNLGLSDANDSDELDGGATYKNSVIQLSVGFFF